MFLLTRLFNFDKFNVFRLPPRLKEQAQLTLHLTLVLLVVFVVYLPSLKNGFVNWDDEVHLLKNPFLQPLDLKHLRAIFTTTVNKIYLPLTLLTFAVERHYFGPWPVIYHLSNLILHLLVTGLVFLLALRLGVSRLGASIGALLFGIHPMHVESVAWVTQRKDVLYSFFYLLALCNYCDYLRAFQDFHQQKEKGLISSGRNFSEPGLMPLLLTFMFGLLSVLAKPMALSLPLTLLLLDWFFRRKLSLRLVSEKALLGILFLPVVWMTYHAHARAVAIRWPDSLLLGIWSFSFYIRKFLYPDNFSLIYHVPEPKVITQPAYVLAVLLFFGFWTVIILRRRDPLLVFGALYFIASVFFLLRWDQQADINIVADRFMYLPSVGFCLCLGWYLQRLFNKIIKRKYKIMSIFFSIFLILILLTHTTKQIKVWNNGIALWQHQLVSEPLAERALTFNKLAEAKMQQRNFQMVARRIKDAKLSDGVPMPEDVEAVTEIIAIIDRALEIKPDYAQAFYQKGLLLFNLGENDLAMKNLENAIQYNDRNFDAFYLYGLLLQRKGKHQQAIQAFVTALRIISDNEQLIRKVEVALQKGLGGDFPELYQDAIDRMK